MRYPQCTSPISNALYIGILALSSEVSEDTTDYTLEKILLVLVPRSINDNYQSEGFGLAVRNYRARSPSRRTKNHYVARKLFAECVFSSHSPPTSRKYIVKRQQCARTLQLFCHRERQIDKGESRGQVFDLGLDQRPVPLISD